MYECGAAASAGVHQIPEAIGHEELRMFRRVLRGNQAGRAWLRKAEWKAEGKDEGDVNHRRRDERRGARKWGGWGWGQTGLRRTISKALMPLPEAEVTHPFMFSLL